jgi:MoxR-like ATPase
VLRHRLVLSYEALAEGQSADQIIRTIMKTLPKPPRPLQTHVDLAQGS